MSIWRLPRVLEGLRGWILRSNSAERRQHPLNSEDTAPDRHGGARTGSVVMVGAFPPPLHGMAAANAAMLGRLKREDSHVFVVDIANRSLSRNILVRASRVGRVTRGLFDFLRVPRDQGRTLYMSVSGGLGQWYECVFASLARLRRKRIFLHHHNYSYVDRQFFVTRLLVKLAGPEATHVVLSPGMGEKLERAYPGVKKTIQLSNGGLLEVEVDGEHADRKKLEAVGFLANITAEKGIFDLFRLARAIEQAGLPVHILLAGPFQDERIEARVRRLLEESSNVEYVGAKYGAEKRAFLERIDVLVFPTRYANEAEPLVIHEALAYGSPVIAFARGAISEVLSAGCGLQVDPEADFTIEALAQIRTWLRHPSAFQRASSAARARANDLRATGAMQVDRLVRELYGWEP